MDEDTWDDPGVAALVERVAVPVKVDADARPDVYSRYHLGGLPSVALLGADGEFIRGATFLTVAELHGFLDGALADWRAGRRRRALRRPAPRAPVRHRPIQEPVQLGHRQKRRAADELTVRA